MTSVTDINNYLLLQKESENIEFKEAKQQFNTIDLFQYCVAIANEGGGKLLLGITNIKPRKIVGTNAYPDISKIKSAIFNKVKFRVDIEEIVHPDGRVLVFNIPPRPMGTAYNFEGKYLMRIGESLVPMTEEQLRRIFNEGRYDFLLDNAKRDLSEEDVVMLLDTQRYFELMNLSLPATRHGIIEKFLFEDFISKSGDLYNITNLGAILFAKNLDVFGNLSRKAPRVILYEGTSKVKTIREQIGHKGYASGFEGLMQFINNLLPTNEIIEQALRKTIKMYPEIAIRELVANALLHQDLEDFSSFVMIEIFSDRIEISNPGKPLIPTDRFIDEYKSRNEKMADVMRRLGICEEKSSGIDKVIAYVESWQLPAPDFTTSDMRTNVKIFSHKAFEDMDKKERIRACYQHSCLLYVSNDKMTNKTLRERFKLPNNKADVISKIISDSVNQGRIKIDNPDNKSRRYAKYIPYWA